MRNKKNRRFSNINRVSLVSSSSVHLLPPKYEHSFWPFALTLKTSSDIAMFKTIFIVAVMINISCGCLITNCPRGGKRSNSLVTVENIARECPACGPGRQGQCFGPNICCGTTIGCFIGTPETYRCRKESLYSRPCIAGFAMCKGNTGRCAANGICCGQETCYVDSTCRITDDINNDRKIGDDLGRSFIDNYQ